MQTVQNTVPCKIKLHPQKSNFAIEVSSMDNLVHPSKLVLNVHSFVQGRAALVYSEQGNLPVGHIQGVKIAL